MSQPPTGSDPDRPQDTSTPFPTYGRVESPQTQRPQDTVPPAPPPYQQQPGWTAPGQPGQSPSSPVQSGQGPSGYGQPGYGQPGYGQPGYGQPGYTSAQSQPGYGSGGYPPGYGQPGYPAAYGTQPAPYGYGYGGVQTQSNGLATASLITGLCSFVLCGISAPVAVGLGIAALVQIKRRQQGGKGQAVAGVIIGGVVTLCGIAYVILMLTLGWSSGDDGY